MEEQIKSDKSKSSEYLVKSNLYETSILHYPVVNSISNGISRSRLYQGQDQ